MEITAVIISIALLQYILFVIRVGLSRNKYNVQAPRTTGNEIWERLFRIQQNTLEQLVIFIPGMVIFTMYVSETWALLPGILFILGRQLYSGLYLKDPASRGPGMFLSFLSNIGLVIAGLIGIGLQLSA
ncbi:MAG: MAPEG family protein [Porticoccaceae bacterium]|jgi:glutathione S-transferase|nr:MAPEG family protein [Porticoccaceae bacterium]